MAIALMTVFACTSVSAEPEIYRCSQDDGTVAFQETPCAEATATEAPADSEEEVPIAASDDFFDFVNPYDEAADAALVEEPRVQSEPPLPPPVSTNRAECEKITRDAIDAIDLEMRRGYSPEDGERYKAELMKLTRQLRACKQLE
jgi:hypothetical protein